MSDHIETIARAFAATIREACADLDHGNGKTPGALIALINDTNKAYGGCCCATHDYFDANMGMALAFVSVVGREPDSASEADADLWSAAWDMAKANGFWPDA